MWYLFIYKFGIRKRKVNIMFKKPLLALAATIFSLVVISAIPSLAVDEAPPEASVNGKYSGLLQVMYCPKDKGSYGDYRDYGHWGGGAWCGQRGKAGYWVWVAPNWYVWKYKGPPPSTNSMGNVPPKATVNGKYSNLIQIMHCPNDRSSYGEFRDYGHWGGGAWCGQTGKAGYWVWVAPNWYIWSNQH